MSGGSKSRLDKLINLLEGDYPQRCRRSVTRKSHRSIGLLSITQNFNLKLQKVMYCDQWGCDILFCSLQQYLWMSCARQINQLGTTSWSLTRSLTEGSFPFEEDMTDGKTDEDLFRTAAGSTPAVCKAAAQQIASTAQTHPQQLPFLLRRVGAFKTALLIPISDGSSFASVHCLIS
jgi:hypothetical protein